MPDKRKFIIYIDDNYQAALLGKVFLERANFHVEICLNTEQARAILETRIPDMIITDIGLPGENGLQFYEWIKSSYLKEMPMLIVSAHAVGFHEVLTSHKDIFFEKPIFFPKLIDKVRELLSPE